MDITAIYKDAITSALNDSLVPLRNDVKTLVAQQNDLYNTVGLVLILIAIMAITIGILFYKLSKQRKLQQENDARLTEQVEYALKEIVNLSEKNSHLSAKLEGEAAKYNQKYVEVANYLETKVNKAIDDLNS